MISPMDHTVADVARLKAVSPSRIVVADKIASIRWAASFTFK
jgi:hypothetical protein